MGGIRHEISQLQHSPLSGRVSIIICKTFDRSETAAENNSVAGSRKASKGVGSRELEAESQE